MQKLHCYGQAPDRQTYCCPQTCYWKHMVCVGGLFQCNRPAPHKPYISNSVFKSGETIFTHIAYTCTYLHIHVDTNTLQMPQDLHVPIFRCNMDTGETSIVPDLSHLQHRLYGDVLDNLLQGACGAELGCYVEGGIPLVISDVNRSTCQQELSHDIQLLQVCCQMQGSLEGGGTKRDFLLSWLRHHYSIHALVFATIRAAHSLALTGGVDPLSTCCTSFPDPILMQYLTENPTGVSYK